MSRKNILITLLLSLLFSACKEEYLAPLISGVDQAEYLLNIGDKLTLAPNIANLKGNSYEWTINGKKIPHATYDYTFEATEPGAFVVVFKAENKGGEARQEFKIEVEKPIEISFDEAMYIVPMCQVMEITPQIEGPECDDYSYEWKLGDVIKGKDKVLEFISVTPGDYELELSVTAGKQTETTTCNIKVENVECNKYPNALLDLQFAPGQSSWRFPFKGAGSFAAPYEEYKEKVLEYIQKNPFAEFKLGGWAGYATFGFDHTIANIPSKDDIQLTIKDYGVSIAAFFVAYDCNKNGKPDEDEWYEIKAPYFEKEEIKIYEKTFTYKGWLSGNNVEYEWKDSESNGTEQANYNRFPGCYKKDDKVVFSEGWNNSYTLKGRQIIVRAQQANQYGKTYNINISDAVNEKGDPVFLPGVDFLKVQNICVMYWKDDPEPLLYEGQRILNIHDKHL